MDIFAPFVHWSFAAVAITIAVAGEFLKRLLFPDQSLKEPTRSTTKKWPWWRVVYYRTMPIQPLVVGGLLGLALAGVAPAVVADRWYARLLYYAVAGVCSTWVYAAVTQWAKRLAGSTVPGG